MDHYDFGIGNNLSDCEDDLLGDFEIIEVEKGQNKGMLILSAKKTPKNTPRKTPRKMMMR